MNEPIDDKSFDEYLGRESQVSKRYRALDADEVPAAVDGLVLARAREAVAKSASLRKKPTWMRWTPPLALAASMVLVISIVIESGTRHEVATREMTSAPRQAAVVDTRVQSGGDVELKQEADASQSAPQADVAPAVVSKKSMQARARAAKAPAPTAVPDTQAVERALRHAPAAPPPAMEPPVVVTASAAKSYVQDSPVSVSAMEASPDVANEARDRSQELEEAIVTGMRRQETIPGRGAGPRGTIQQPPAAYSEVSEEEAARQQRAADPKLWLQYIRELRETGKSRQADREWRSFRKAYPQYEVSEMDTAPAK